MILLKEDASISDDAETQIFLNRSKYFSSGLYDTVYVLFNPDLSVPENIFYTVRGQIVDDNRN